MTKSVMEYYLENYVTKMCNKDKIGVWQKLEEQNHDFLKDYYTMLKLKKHIILFNHFLEQQYQLMRLQVPPTSPLVPMQNGMHPSPSKFS